MNNTRRKKIQQALLLINQVSSMLENVLEEEEEAYNNIPENLQDSSNSQEVIDDISEAIGSLEDIVILLEDL